MDPYKIVALATLYGFTLGIAIGLVHTALHLEGRGVDTDHSVLQLLLSGTFCGLLFGMCAYPLYLTELVSVRDVKVLAISIPVGIFIGEVCTVGLAKLRKIRKKNDTDNDLAHGGK